jgi:hypothetical protein
VELAVTLAGIGRFLKPNASIKENTDNMGTFFSSPTLFQR